MPTFPKLDANIPQTRPRACRKHRNAGTTASCMLAFGRVGGEIGEAGA